MKQIKKTQLFFIILLTIFAINGCKKDYDFLKSQNKDLEKVVQAAKIYHQNFTSTSKGANHLAPDWEKSEINKLSTGGEILIVPAVQYYFTHDDLSVFRTFIFYKANHQNQVTAAEIVEFIGNKSYLKNNQKALITYLRDKNLLDFEGAVIEYDLDYKYLRGGKV